MLSLKHVISETNTLARLKALQEGDFLNHDLWASATDAYELQMQQRLIHQLGQMGEGVLPDNHIDPEHLSDLEKRMLKEAFVVIEKVYSVLDKMYPVA